MDALLQKLGDAARSQKLLDSAFKNIVELLRTDELPQWISGTLTELIQQDHWSELNDRFFKPIEFGTAGMRGRCVGKVTTTFEKKKDTYLHAAVGTTCMNDLNVIIATLGLFKYCKAYLETTGDFPKRPSLVIAHDTRFFSQHFCELVASTWSQLGGDTYTFTGPRSTPQLSFSVRFLKTIAGVMITASHNPFYDNGYKVYFLDGAQINQAHAQGITQCIQAVTYMEALKFLDKDLRHVFTLPPRMDEIYLKTCQSAVLDKPLFDSMKRSKIIYTPLHGTGSVCVLPLLKSFGWDLLPVTSQMKMDGAFPTVKSPNPDNLETLTLALEEAKRLNADGIIATDPDGDRMSVMLKNSKQEWSLLNGNTIAVLLAAYRLQAMKKLGLLPEDLRRVALIKSFVTTPLLKVFAEKNGMKIIETHTGFKWIGEKLLDYECLLKEHLWNTKGLVLDYTQCDYEARKTLMLKESTFFFLGAEESCGFLANDAIRDKDANAATLMFCEVIAYLKSKGRSFSDYLDEIYAAYGYFKEDLLSFSFEGAEGLHTIQRLMASYRQEKPEHINGIRVSETIDFLNKGQKDADGKDIPPADFIVIQLLDGCTIAIRPSGTEPKLKMYLFGHEELTDNKNLDTVKSNVLERIASLKEWLRADIQQRAR